MEKLAKAEPRAKSVGRNELTYERAISNCVLFHGNAKRDLAEGNLEAAATCFENAAYWARLARQLKVS